MECDRCKTEHRTIDLTEIDDEKVNIWLLCPECYQALNGFMANRSIQKTLDEPPTEPYDAYY
jgi:protein-arginine kinase activator protein McsA